MRPEFLTLSDRLNEAAAGQDVTPMSKVFAPVSIGNLSVGFDSLGLALSPIDGTLLGDQVQVEPSDSKQSELQLAGSHIHYLPAEADKNIVWHCYEQFVQASGNEEIRAHPIRMTLYKNIPVSSGLGSSAASIVAALTALNLYFDSPFSEQQLLLLMGEMEGQISGGIHYDNVAPSFLGGLQLMLPEDLGEHAPVAIKVPFFDDLYWLLAYPDVEVSTKKAREILPRQFSMAELIRFGQRLSAFVDACHRGDQRLAMTLIKDDIAEPHRRALLPNFEETKQALLNAGALTVGISGSGPTLFAAFDSPDSAKQGEALVRNLYLKNPGSFCHICQTDNLGAREI